MVTLDKRTNGADQARRETMRRRYDEHTVQRIMLDLPGRTAHPITDGIADNSLDALGEWLWFAKVWAL